MGTQLRAPGLDWPAMAPGPSMCGLLRANQEGHALGKGGQRGVLGSFRDFMQNQFTYGKGPSRGNAKGAGHIGGDTNRRVSLGLGKTENEPCQASVWPQMPCKGRDATKGGVCLLLSPQTAGQSRLGKGYGMSRRTRDEGPGKREQECLLGRGKLASWGLTSVVAQPKQKESAAVRAPCGGLTALI